MLGVELRDVRELPRTYAPLRRRLASVSHTSNSSKCHGKPSPINRSLCPECVTPGVVSVGRDVALASSLKISFRLGGVLADTSTGVCGGERNCPAEFGDEDKNSEEPLLLDGRLSLPSRANFAGMVNFVSVSRVVPVPEGGVIGNLSIIRFRSLMSLERLISQLSSAQSDASGDR